MPALLVVDMFHGTDVASFADAKNAGLVGIIHKASQGATSADSRYAQRRDPARQAGLLWGAYHFATGEPVDAQIENFMSAAAPDGDTLMALDFEPNGGAGGTMSLSQARDFLGKLGDRLGRKPVIYSGALVKEQLGDAVDAFFGAHRLWLAQYGPTPRVQRSWQCVLAVAIFRRRNRPRPARMSGHSGKCRRQDRLQHLCGIARSARGRMGDVAQGLTPPRLPLRPHRGAGARACELARREAAQAVEHAGPALAARERAIERRERARQPLVVVIDPGAQHAGEQRRHALRADHAARSGRVDPGGVEHPGLRAHREAVERQGKARIARTPSASASASPRDAAPSPRCGASARRTAARAAAPRPCRHSPPASTLRSSSFMCAARIASVLANSPRSVASETSACLAMSPKPISSIALLGEQRHQRRDDPFAVGAAGRREGRRGFAAWAEPALERVERCGLRAMAGSCRCL